MSAKKVPVVDISGLYSTDFQDRKAAADQIGAAVHDVGFFYVSGHGVSEEIQQDMFAAAKEFFALDEHTKMKYYIGNSYSHKGYVPPGSIDVKGAPTNDYEAYDFGLELDESHPLVQKPTPFYGHNQWPRELPGFKEKVMKYHTAVEDLSFRLLRAFALVMGLPEHELDQYFDDPMEPTRMIRYPVATEPELMIGSHEDPEAITVLLSNEPGLEIEYHENEWIDVPPVPGTFIVNIGQVIEYMSNGLIKARKHHVRQVSRERISFPFFLSPNYAVRMAPIPQFEHKGPLDDVYKDVKSGDVLWAAMMQAYSYTVERVNRGETKLPEGVRIYRQEWLPEAPQT